MIPSEGFTLLQSVDSQEGIVVHPLEVVIYDTAQE
eukprot:COSAG06_NODE_51334_length_313_cov_0.425234_1_plen_34_part_01